MIKKNELKIGNWVDFNETNTPSKVVGIHEFGIDVETDEEVFYTEYDQFSPIAPTKENLLKFGFKDDGNGWMSLGRVCLFNIDSNNTVIRVYPSKDQLQLKIDSLHHLQNVLYYFAGLELGGKL